MNELKPYYTVKQISEKLNIKPSMIYALIRNGNLECVRVGNKYLFEIDSVRKCFDAWKVE